MESMKISFTLASKPTSMQNHKPPPTDFSFFPESDSTHSKHELFTEFDPLKTPTQEKPTYKIPRLENTWNPHKKMRNLDIPPTDIRFEVEAPNAADATNSSMGYGLNIRVEEKDDELKKNDTQFEATQMTKNLAEDHGMEEFDPKELAVALLKAYGWSKGKGIGKTAKKDVKVVQHVKRPNLLGLGFVPYKNYTYKNRHDRRNIERRESSSDMEKRRDVDENNGSEYRPSTPFSWLTDHIRVKIISKDFEGGRLYLKKGEVVDVVAPDTCAIFFDESKELVQGVNHAVLETVVPKPGGPVLVLYGKHKGVSGHLIEKDLENETGVIEDDDRHELLNVNLEQIAEYIGDPSCLYTDEAIGYHI